MSSDSPAYAIDELIIDVSSILSRRFRTTIDDDQIKWHNARLAAASLLQAFGVTPETDPSDNSPAARFVRELMLEDATHLHTKPRRAL